MDCGVECGVWSVECGMWNVECGVWGVGVGCFCVGMRVPEFVGNEGWKYSEIRWFEEMRCEMWGAYFIFVLLILKISYHMVFSSLFLRVTLSFIFYRHPILRG